MIVLLSLAGCALRSWEYPYPPVPLGVPAADKKWYSTGGQFRHDAVELDPDNKEIFESIDEEVEEAVKNHPQNGEFGFVHTFWETKRRILYWKYDIDWHDVQDMTPGLMVD